jgi:hypothetical protein
VRSVDDHFVEPLSRHGKTKYVAAGSRGAATTNAGGSVLAATFRGKAQFDETLRNNY